MASVESVFIGCNRELYTSDYSERFKLVAFGAGITISLWNPLGKDYKGVLTTLKSHTKEVLCVKWVPQTSFLLSTSEDCLIKLWKVDNNGENYQVVSTINHHKHSVTSLALAGSSLFLSGDASGLLCFWHISNEGDLELLHEFTVKDGFYPLSLALQQLSGGDFLALIGGTNTNIYVFSFTYDNFPAKIANFAQSAVLAGHEDWVKSIVVKMHEGDFFIASGAQDRYIRLWKLCLNEKIDVSDEDSTKLTLLSNKQYKFTIGQTRCAIHFDAIIMGHDDWISHLNWHPTKLELLSASSDTSVMIWKPDPMSGIWVGKTRLGELSMKGASTATGSSGGFWSSLWIFENEKQHILTNGRTGSWRLWSSSNGDDWDQQLAITGAIKSVTDLEWSENGEYLLATSLDQTTRLYARWMSNSDGSPHSPTSWHEFARPQIHGYDMVCVSCLSNNRFISGGEEKILRSFDEPKGVAKLLEKFCSMRQTHIDEMPESASLPVLGLSNKAENESAVTHENINNDEEDEDQSEKNISYEVVSALDQPPLEDHLQRHTLWPEIEKLYGHGYEITSVDSSPDKQLVASSCRSNTAAHAVVRVFDTKTWQQLPQVLEGHDLTITRLQFSPNNQFLLAVSRDRRFSLWKRTGSDLHHFELLKLQEKAHSRIIWDCCWAPSDFSDSTFFTVSRDKHIKAWSYDQAKKDTVQLASLKLDEQVTAVDSLKFAIDGKAVIALGTESGSVKVFSFNSNNEFVLIHELEYKIAPGDRVNRISISRNLQDKKLLMGVGSSDTSTRIYILTV
ncbi:BA75_04535T0 [Komagataella pastoris]|uniref:Elongator complex protein 2 n=1 Tax=Komagataella pastoris TaxID=4922 RepID=A0A1B2JH18_PICPA|nr:BA75_04535T0 [Komagataella pastoris]